MAENSIEKTPTQIKQDRQKFTEVTLKRIGEYILEGLSEDEACVLAGFDPDVFHRAREADKGIRLYLEKQRVQFKHIHLKQINEKRSDKNSMWILEKTLPEFGPNRNKQVAEETATIIGAIIREIQNDHGTANIINVPATDTTAKREINQAVLSVDSFLK